MFAKIGPGRKYHLPLPGRRVFLDDVGAGDVRRHQVRGELNARELEIDDARQRMDQEGLGQTRHADDQAVAAHEQRQQHLIDRVVLTDDQLV